MKHKIILCLALVLSGTTVFAFIASDQIKRGDPHPGMLIRSGLDSGSRCFWVIVLPQKNYSISFLKGELEINDGTNHLASCQVEGATMWDVPANSRGGLEQSEQYRAMTNWFSRPLNGARLFQFQVAKNLLASSTFSVGEYSMGTGSSTWFYLKDFSDEK
jgi:hypothetical protein